MTSKFLFVLSDESILVVWGFIQAVGILDYGLAKVADMVIKYVITPAVNGRSCVSFVVDIIQEAGLTTEAILKIVPPSGPEVNVKIITCNLFGGQIASRFPFLYADTINYIVEKRYHLSIICMLEQ